MSEKFKEKVQQNLEILDFSRLGVFSPTDFHTLLCLTSEFKVIHDGDLKLRGNRNKVQWRKKAFKARYEKIKEVAS